MLVPLDQEGVTINAIHTMGGVPMGDERTNEVFIDNVFVPDEYVVGEVNKGFQYISQALDLERFTMFTFSPIKQRLDLLVEYVRVERGVFLPREGVDVAPELIDHLRDVRSRSRLGSFEHEMLEEVCGAADFDRFRC
jgi:alkylation response protein AidB-like acyl-CoA dehydrogenase